MNQISLQSSSVEENALTTEKSKALIAKESAKNAFLQQQPLRPVSISTTHTIKAPHLYPSKAPTPRKPSIAQTTTKYRKLYKSGSLTSLSSLIATKAAGSFRTSIPDKHLTNKQVGNYGASRQIQLLQVASKYSHLSRIVLKRYLKEKQSFRSVEQFAIFKLNQLDTAATTLPNAVRTSIICDLFESLTNTRQYNPHIMNRLKLELYRSIYGTSGLFGNCHHIQQQSLKTKIPTKAFFQSIPFFQQMDIMEREQRDIPQTKLVNNGDDNNDNNNNKQKVLSTNSVAKQVISEAAASMTKNKSIVMKLSTQHANISKQHFTAWKMAVRQKMSHQAALQTKIRTNATHCMFKLRRSHFSAWKDYVLRKKLEFHKNNARELQRKLEESQRAAMSLIRKTDIAEKEVIRIRQMRSASETAREEIIGKNALQFELESSIDNLKQLQRKLRRLQRNSDLVYSRLLLSNKEQKNRIKLDSLFAEEIVMRWVSFHLRTIANYNKIFDRPLPTDVKNFTTDFADCSVLFLLMHKLRGEMQNIDYQKLSLCFQTSKRKQCVETCVKEMQQFINDTDGFNGFITVSDLYDTQSDIIFVFLVNLMQKYPNLSFSTNVDTQVKGMFFKIENVLGQFESNNHYHIDSLKDLLIHSETASNQTKTLIESIEQSHLTWLSAINKCQSKSLSCLAAQQFGNSVYIYDDLEIKRLSHDSNSLLHLEYVKMRTVIRKNKHNDKGNKNELPKDEKWDILELKGCEQVIQEHFHYIQDCFRFYGSSLEQVKVLLKDVKLYDSCTAISDKYVTRAFKLSGMTMQTFAEKYGTTPPTLSRANSEISLNYDSTNHQLNRKTYSKTKLTISQFAEFLVRIAYRKFQAKHASLSEKLCWLLRDYIVRNAASDKTLLHEIESKQMQKTLQVTLKSQLQEAFHYYANHSNLRQHRDKKKLKRSKSRSNVRGSDMIDTNIGDQTGITFAQFSQMMDELQLISSKFTHLAFKSIFRRAGRNSETLDYNSFEKCLVTVAICKKPDPYLPLSTRVEDFLAYSVINPLYQQNKISKGLP